MSRLTWQWWDICYLVLSPDLFKLSIHHIAQIKHHDAKQGIGDWQDCDQVHCQDATHDRRRPWLQNHQWNYATLIHQCGDPSNTIRRRTSWGHWYHHEADAIYYPLNHSVGQPAQPGSIPHSSRKIRRGPPRPTTTPGRQRTDNLQNMGTVDNRIKSITPSKTCTSRSWIIDTLALL